MKMCKVSSFRLQVFGFLFLLSSSFVLADESPAVSIFGGYSFANLGTHGTGFSRPNLHGWGASITGHLKGNLGITADMSGHYGHPTVRFQGIEGTPFFRDFFFLAGPRISTTPRRLTGFGEVLIGVESDKTNSLRIGTEDSPVIFPANASSNFALALGGGLDLKVNNQLAVRLVQVDYLPVHGSPKWSQSFRVQTGLVFLIGR